MQTIEQSFNTYKNRPKQTRLNTLLKCSERLIYKICYQVLKHHHDAEDATQIAMVKVLKVIEEVKTFKHYTNLIYKISINTCINSIRSRKRRQKREHIAQEQMYANRVHEHPTRSMSTQEHISLLNNPLQSIVSGYYFEGETIRSLSQRKKCSSSTIYALLKAGREQLRQSMLNN